jgi:hypothetical protein
VERLRRIAPRALAAVYLAGLWLDGAGCSAPARVLPRSVALFLDVAALFTEADHYVLQYRAEGWVCSAREWRELDPRPYFPIDVDNKESRFQRVMYMHHKDARTMRALDAFLVDHHNRLGAADGIPREQAIGGVRLMALHSPLPNPGEPVERFAWRPLARYPEDQRNVWYHTSSARIAQRCGESEAAAAPPPPGAAAP